MSYYQRQAKAREACKVANDADTVARTHLDANYRSAFARVAVLERANAELLLGPQNVQTLNQLIQNNRELTQIYETQARRKRMGLF